MAKNIMSLKIEDAIKLLNNNKVINRFRAKYSHEDTVNN